MNQQNYLQNLFLSIKSGSQYLYQRITDNYIMLNRKSEHVNNQPYNICHKNA